MELIYAVMLLHKAGKEITEENVKKVLSAIGVEKTDGEIKALIAALTDVDIEKAIKEAVVPVASAPAGEGGKKEEKKEEVREDPEKAAAGLGALFG